jgi:flagellar hook protein FlgE
MLSVVMSGLNAAQKQLEVTSNNVANAGTVGFEGSTASFADVFANDPSANPKTAVGSGVVTAAVQRSTAQGSMTTTGNVTNLAITGSGFFVLSPAGSSSQTYTRAGNFSLSLDTAADTNGNICALTDTSGNQVQCIQPLPNSTGSSNPILNPTTNTDGSLASIESGALLGPVLIPTSYPLSAVSKTGTFADYFLASNAQTTAAKGTDTAGALQGISIDSSGIITATYADANNTKITIGQVALAQFANPSALKPIGNTDFAASASSGTPNVVGAGAPRAGNIMSGTLEQSNVDITAQLMQMIQAQQLYNGNARMLQTAVEVGSRITDKI